jgi:hypothetical protein
MCPTFGFLLHTPLPIVHFLMLECNVVHGLSVDCHLRVALEGYQLKQLLCRTMGAMDLSSWKYFWIGKLLCLVDLYPSSALAQLFQKKYKGFKFAMGLSQCDRCFNKFEFYSSPGRGPIVHVHLCHLSAHLRDDSVSTIHLL